MQSAFHILGVLALSVAAMQASAQRSGIDTALAPMVAVQTKNLHPDEAIHFSTPARVAIASKIKCGPGGDIYAAYSSNARVEVWDSPLRKISLSSKQVTEYPIPSIAGYDKLSRASFDVDTHGTLYVLLQAHPHPEAESDVKFAYLIVKYKEDGSVDSYYPLAELPGRKIQPTSLTMFADGNSLVSGTFRGKAAPSSAPGAFSAIFNQTGAYRGQVTIVSPADPGPGRQDSLSSASSLLTFGSPDGNIYVLQDEHLNVVSQSGSIERKIDLPTPNKDVSPVQMAAAGVGYLFAFYDHISTGSPGETAERRSMIRVANLQTGEVTATYRMVRVESDLTVAACAVSINDFVFLSSDPQNNLEVIHYRSR
jgi:hypothetical protein